LYDKNNKIPRTHNLVTLWRLARPNIEAVWPGSETKTYLNLVEERLKEMCELDSGSYAFRYPEDINGKPFTTRNKYINLKQFMDVILGISNCLDGANTGMEEHLNSKNEMMAEYRVEMRCENDQY
jgi:hypothetical protein